MAIWRFSLRRSCPMNSRSLLGRSESGASLTGAPTAAPAGYTPSPVANPVVTPNPSYVSPARGGSESFGYQAATGAAAAAMQFGNPSVANKAAIWLGLLMPYFGL